MASRFQILVVATLSFGIVPAAPARGDIITIISGGANLPWDDPGGFSLGGDGFLLTSMWFAVPVWPQGTCFRGCAPGTNIDLSAVFGGQPGNNLGQGQAAVVNGVTYAAQNEFDTWLRLAGQLSFDAGQVIAPPLPAEADRILYLTTPFALHGDVAAFRDSAAGTSPLFQVDLTGRGTATVRLIDDGSGLWRYPEVSFSFTEQTPVPEPASLLLVGGGLAGLLLGARRRRLWAERVRPRPRSSATSRGTRAVSSTGGEPFATTCCTDPPATWRGPFRS